MVHAAVSEFNKTNGITPRRWLLYANAQLCGLIEKYIGKEFYTDFNKIADLMNYVDSYYSDSYYSD